MGMEPRATSISRIRCVRNSNPRAFTPEIHRKAYLIAFAEPAYPLEAMAQGIEGKVVLEALINREGFVQTLSPRAGHPLLAQSALQTVREWNYRPTTLNGVPVEVVTEIEVSFSLPDTVVSS